MEQDITLSVFFPAYNEEKNIEETVTQAIGSVEGIPGITDYEIIVVNDGSSDATGLIAEGIATRNPKVRVVTHPKNRGYGAALKSGIAAARMDYVFFTDADLQFDMSEIKNLLAHLSKHDVVIGYRSPRRDPFMRIVNAWGWNKLNRLLFGLRVRDVDCAFKVFKRSDIQSLPLQSEGAMIGAEILIRLTRKGITIKEIPVSHLPRKAGSPTGAKPSVILTAFGEMVQLYRGELGPVTQKQALKFMSVGVVNTLLDVIAYIYLTRETHFFSEHLIVAKFLSFLAGTVSSLILNRYWTFGLRSRLTLPEVFRFYTMTSVSIVVNVVMMDFLISLGMYDLIALAITTVFTFITNFTLSKVWVFKHKEIRVTPIELH